jgi:hypothetical protein
MHPCLLMWKANEAMATCALAADPCESGTPLPYSTCIASPEVCTTQIGEGRGGKFEESEKIAGVGVLGIGGAIKAMEKGIL